MAYNPLSQQRSSTELNIISTDLAENSLALAHTERTDQQEDNR